MVKRNKFIIFLVILCMSLMVFGCSTTTKKNVGKPQTTVPQGTTTNYPTTTPPVVTTTPPVVTTTGPAVAVPAKLTSLESNAIKVIGEVSKKRWVTARKTTSTMVSEVKSLRTTLTLAGIPANIINDLSTLVDKLNSAVKAKKSYESKIYANDVTGYIADIQGAYRVTVPPDMSRICYYLRDIEYTIEKKDWTRVNTDTGNVKKYWVSLRTSLNKNSSAVKNMDKIIKSLEASVKKKSTKMTLRDAKKALIYTDAVKKLYVKKK